jgi:hypothetical protein
MKNVRTYAIGAAIAAAGLVSVNGVAFATTGHPWILGQGNTANQTTQLARTTNGPAVALHTRPGSPPLAVNSSAVVAHLDADQVDGFHGTDLTNRVYRYNLPTITTASAAHVNFPALPPGLYLASYSVTTNVSAPGTNMDCAISNTSPSFHYEIAGRASAPGGFASVSGSGVVDTRSGTATFACFSTGGTFTWYNAQPNYSTISFLRINGLVTQNGTSSRSAAHGERTARP